MNIYIWLLSLLIFFSVASIPGCAEAQQTAFKSTRIQLFQINYSGEKEKSFSEGSTGAGIEAYSDWGKGWGRLYTKVRGTQASGSQNFVDGTTSTKCNYTFYQGQFEAGFVLFPIPTRDPGMGLYISAGGNIGYDWLSLSSATNSVLTSLKPSESALSYGYAAGVGVEWSLSKGVGKRNALSGEITYRSDNASIGGQSSFDLSGLAIHIGYGW